MRVKWIAVVALLGWSVLLDAQTRGAMRLRVAADGSGDCRSVQEAVDRATESGAVITIAPGTYREKLHVSKANIHFIGTGESAAAVVLSFGDSAKTAGGTSKSASVTVDADGFMAENLTIENTWSKDHPDPAERSQAVALLIASDRAVLDRVRLIGWQDTLYANSRSCREGEAACMASREFFHDCYITGEVDYIFGDAKAVFKNCELQSQVHSMVTITAQSKHYAAEDSGYYFLHCRITGADGLSKLYFGRPWRDYSTVTFYDTDIEQQMEAAGWLEW